jgi:hypothetical protein
VIVPAGSYQLHYTAKVYLTTVNGTRPHTLSATQLVKVVPPVNFQVKTFASASMYTLPSVLALFVAISCISFFWLKSWQASYTCMDDWRGPGFIERGYVARSRALSNS